MNLMLWAIGNNARQKLLPAAAILCLALSTAPAFAKDLSPVMKVPAGDLAMDAAFAKAAASLDDFFAVWRNPPAGAKGFSVKIGLIDTPNPPGYAIVQPREEGSGKIEWFWTRDLRTDGAGFAAEIDNDPEWLEHVQRGWTIHFARQDIGDWMYLQNGKIIGNATACPALAHASADERRQMKELVGIDCEGGAR